jgi:hypothetical protein
LFKKIKVLVHYCKTYRRWERGILQRVSSCGEGTMDCTQGDKKKRTQSCITPHASVVQGFENVLNF